MISYEIFFLLILIPLTHPTSFNSPSCFLFLFFVWQFATIYAEFSDCLLNDPITTNIWNMVKALREMKIWKEQ